MKNLIPYSQVEKILENFKERVVKEVLNTIEIPMTTEQAYLFLGYPTRKALQNDLGRIPKHKAANGKIYFYRSELNEWIRLQAQEVA